MPFIAGANLTALNKKNGDIRPIAAGDTLRHLTAKCLCSLVRDTAASYFLPCQLGVAVPGGAGSIIHGLSATWENSDGLDIALSVMLLIVSPVRCCWMSVSVYFQEFTSGVILHHLIFSTTIGSFHHHQEFSKETRWVYFFFVLCYTS